MSEGWHWRWRGLAAVSALTGYAFAVQGYHPFAEDGGVYAAGVRKLLDPGLYPAYSGFVTEHLRFSLFAPMLAAGVRGTWLPLEWVLLLGYVIALWLTLRMGWMLAARMTADLPARVGAVAVLAGAMSLPLAGTSQYLNDPYLTARSFSTPLGLLALAWALDGLRGRRRGWTLSGLALLGAALLHPLMAGYGAAALAALVVVGSPWPAVRRWGPWVLAGVALVVAGIVQALSPAESADYLRIVASRYYWFPFLWHWYEWVGLVGPLLVIAVLASALRKHAFAKGMLIARATLVLAGISLLVAVVFARFGLRAHGVARLQPLRCFGLVYTVMLLLGGMWLGKRVLRRSVWRWAVLLLGLGSGMFAVQRDMYAHSNHLELPGRAPRNGWVQAFLWIRANTPQDAVFALDEHYITEGRHEDAQCFRAWAERSALPDWSKDGGEASITPGLTAAWAQGFAAQAGLERESDGQRVRRLAGTGAGWVVLERASATELVCPYRNGEVQVCQLP